MKEFHPRSTKRADKMRNTKGNRRKSYAFLLSFFVFCAFLLPFGQGCKTTENEKNVRVEKEEDTINIGMSFDSFVIDRTQRADHQRRGDGR